MPAKLPHITAAAVEKLVELGRQIHDCRKALRISATAAAEAAGMSRVTWYRIEQGEPSVTIGAYLNAIKSLGLDFTVNQPAESLTEHSAAAGDGMIPARIRLSDYPQLKQLAWQVHGTDTLKPTEALSIYERNWRHIDVAALEKREQQLIAALRTALGENGNDV